MLDQVYDVVRRDVRKKNESIMYCEDYWPE